MNRINELFERLRGALASRWDGLPSRVRQATPYAAILLAGLLLGYMLFGRTNGHDHDDYDGVQFAEGDDDGGDAVEWTCSMHPQVRQPGPGSCPICGMDLIPVSADDGRDDQAELPRLSVSERAAALMSVQVWPAERRGLASEVSLYGTIDYDETRMHDVVSRREGQIERLLVNYEQASVQRGQHLADVFSPAIQAASEELLQARQAARGAGVTDLVAAAREQLVALGVSEAQIQRILETGEPARTYALSSPVSGIVSDLNVRQGEWFGSGERLMRVADLRSVWVQFEAYERDLQHLQVGGPMRFTVESFPGESFTGSIAFVDPVVDATSRTARVRVQVNNSDGRLKPGMLARGQAIGTATADAPIVIPSTATLYTGRRSLVYVRLPDFDTPTFEARQVTVGARNGAYTEIVDGITEGELVVVNGAFKIDSELQIRGRESMMGGGAPAHQHGPDPGQHDDHPLPEVDSDVVHLSSDGGRQLETMVRAYLDVAGALSLDDGSAARAAARRLESALNDASLSELDGEAVRDWNRLRRQMLGHVSVMAETDDLDALRHELLPLSHQLETSIVRYHSDVVGTLFRAVCPMVNGSEGFWLTRRHAVENPYHGSAMFDCGEVEEQVAG
ncbi:MAG: efflux RND transporter periplasmic adaptor subunit [Bacteroidota bacterium]